MSCAFACGVPGSHVLCTLCLMHFPLSSAEKQNGLQGKGRTNLDARSPINECSQASTIFPSPFILILVNVEIISQPQPSTRIPSVRQLRTTAIAALGSITPCYDYAITA